jgi:ubiquinone biosynthesis protein Coq4
MVTADTDTVGETELQAFTYAQARTPFAPLIALGGLLKARGGRFALARRVWHAYRRGQSAQPLMYRAWERRFESPLADVCSEVGLG